MTNNELAKLLIEDFGGSGNLREVINCMTRVRVKVNNPDLIAYENIKSREGVLGLVEGEQVQVILGPGKSEKVARAMANLSDSNFSEETDKEKLQRKTQENKESYKAKQKQSGFKKFTSSIASVFVPLIPAFVGAGLIGGVASVLQNMVTAGSVSQESVATLIQVLNIMKNGLYAYLNIFIGINAARVFKANQGLGGVVGGMVYLTGMNPDMPINNIFLGTPLAAGQGGVIGVLVSVWILSKVENALHKAVPDSLDIIIVPAISLIIVGLLHMFIIMPLAGLISNGLIGFIDGVINIGGPISGFILGALFLPMVMLGLHQILTPIHVAMIESQGATYLLPILAMAGAGQVGAAIAILVKCKNNKQIQTIAKGGLPVGILGIGEPLIYALTLPMGKAFITACIGGGVGGAVICLIGSIGATAIGPSGIALIPLIYNNRWLGYLAGLIAGYVGGFVATYFFGIDEKYVEGASLDNSNKFEFK
ncbi:PTS system EIIBC component SA0186 [Anaerococcus prevotii]|uniref:Phosphotransferase system EIIC n=1 Tax=Anaerococcus prevotii (strain ATCC 9321 / DSM 20548 / JCM 6508 / NCTC 11806 / PC1) TaxID=525919 RepID=C7REE8_ANAPD|nr:PTS transporter subunit EIIC [Anaerococcus prevotii]ACV29561.1 phosphotransferase system EIIC [Anaerococcus prevotii DSM 20548]SUU95235.1 PTS system EIIBC component SA0186 [Anaerococcus prevotii]